MDKKFAKLDVITLITSKARDRLHFSISPLWWQAHLKLIKTTNQGRSYMVA